MAFALADIISGVVGGLGNTVVNAGTADQRARAQAQDQIAQQQAAADAQKQQIIMNFALGALQTKQQSDAQTTKVVLIVSGLVVFGIVLVVAMKVRQTNTV